MVLVPDGMSRWALGDVWGEVLQREFLERVVVYRVWVGRQFWNVVFGPGGDTVARSGDIGDVRVGLFNRTRLLPWYVRLEYGRVFVPDVGGFVVTGRD